MKKMGIGQLNTTRLLSIIAIVVLAAFLLILIQTMGAFATSVTTLNTTAVTAADYINSTGYLFRNETVLLAEQQGPILYLSNDGDKVATNSKLAVLYPDGTGDSAGYQTQVLSLQAQIAFLKNAIGEGLNLSNLSATQADIRTAWLKIMKQMSDGNLGATFDAENELLIFLTRYHVLTDKGATAKEILVDLEKQLNELLSSYNSDGISIYNSTLYSPDGANKGNFSMATEYVMPDSGIPSGSLAFQVGSGYFYRASRVDGYENVFTLDVLKKITPSSLKQLTDLADDESMLNGKKVVGKMVSSPEWFVAIPMDADAVTITDKYGDFNGWRLERDGDVVANVAPGDYFNVTFNDLPNQSISMKLDRVVASSDDGLLLILSSFAMPNTFRYTRVQSVKVELNHIAGYHVPASALVKEKGETGVYVLDGNKVNFRKITILFEGEGYYIVENRDAKEARYDRYQSDLAADVPEEEAAAILHEGDLNYKQYLYLNDHIITSGTNLYAGKLLK